MPRPCFPLPCCAAQGLECIFPIWFTQCGRVWFTLAMARPCHALTMPFFSRPQHGRRETAMLCRDLEKNGMVRAWHGRGMASVNQTRPHCVNQMGKIHSKPLAARHGRGTAWARHAMCESAFIDLNCTGFFFFPVWRIGNSVDILKRYSVTVCLFWFDLLSELARHSGHVQNLDISAVQEPE